MNASDRESLNVLVGEYVLGLLEGSEATEVAARIEADPLAAAMALEWERRFMAFTDRLPVEPADADLWAHVARSAFGPGAPKPSAVRRSPAAARGVPWWEHLNVWRWAAAGLVVAVLALAVLPNALRPVDDGQTHVAVLQAPGQTAQPGWVLRVEGNGDVALRPLVPEPVPANRSVQLWTLAPGETKPRSLGLVRTDQPLTVSADDVGPVQPGQLFEMTVEPEGGSPTGGPTGPILFIGRTVIASAR